MNRRHASDRPLVRRDAQGQERTAGSWESLTERLIREAQEEGQFEDLPSHGRPLALDDDRYAGYMASANRLLRNAGAAPPWIELDKSVRELLDRIESVMAHARRAPKSARPRLSRELDALADTHDAAVGRLEMMAPTPAQQRARLDRASLWRRLTVAFGDSEATQDRRRGREDGQDTARMSGRGAR